MAGNNQRERIFGNHLADGPNCLRPAGCCGQFGVSYYLSILYRLKDSQDLALKGGKPRHIHRHARKIDPLALKIGAD